MARIRSCKPEFYDNERLAELSLTSRYLYRAMWHWLDKNGVGERGAKYWKAKVFPYDEDIDSKKVEKCIESLVVQKRLFEIVIDDKAHLFCPDMPDHQNFHREEKSKYPYSLDELKSMVPEQCKNSTSTVPAQQRSEIGDLKSEICNQRSEALSAADLQELWNQHCDPLPKCKTLGRSREDKARAQIKFHPDKSHWVDSIKKFTASKFCRDEWRPGFDDWLDEKKRIRALEGKYDGTSARDSPKTFAQQTWDANKQSAMELEAMKNGGE